MPVKNILCLPFCSPAIRPWASIKKHYRHLRYLSSQHCNSLSSIKFSLSPFSFLFVLEGAKQRHIVLETLDKTEATYVWSFDTETDIVDAYQSLEEPLHLVRQDGRKAFLKVASTNFTRIKHDNNDERRGFVIWRDQLQAVLY